MWKKIKDYENYEINEDGQIKRNGKIRKFSISGNGYVGIILSKNSINKSFLVHRLVAQAFILNPENKPVVNHIDANKKNNNLKNLEWVTHSENIKHSIHVTKNLILTLDNSKPFIIRFKDGKIVKYNSGLEFQRETGMDATSISMARRKNCSEYKFASNRGLSGITVYF